MIAGCPTCGARYRIDTTKLRAEGARLRCSRCETVFRVRPPEVSVGDAPTVIKAKVPNPPARPGSAPNDPARTVLIAHPEADAGKEIADALASWGLHPLLVHDGVEAILNIQRVLPRVVVLDAALPKMFGFQVCELMKRNAQLRSIPVVLVGAIHDQDRYRRAPEDLFGADAYAERQELPGALGRLLPSFGLDVGPGAAAESAPRSPAAAPPEAIAPVAPVGRPAPQPAPAVAPVPQPAPTAVAPSRIPEQEQAERLARIIVSDIVLYNQEKFDAAVRAGNVVEALGSELEEGYSLFTRRVDGAFDAREFLQGELARVAQTRGGS